VHRYLERFAATGVGWPLSTDGDNVRLEQLLFGNRRGRPTGPVSRPVPDFVALQDELRKYPHLTLQLRWEEYRAQQPGGYGYSRLAISTVADSKLRMWSGGRNTGRAKNCLSTGPEPGFRCL